MLSSPDVTPDIGSVLDDWSRPALPAPEAPAREQSGTRKPRYLVIVRRGETALYEYLKQALQHDRSTIVLMDRRCAEDDERIEKLGAQGDARRARTFRNDLRLHLAIVVRAGGRERPSSAR